MLTGGICLTGESELADVKCPLIYGMPLQRVSARGESDHGTLPVRPDCFPSTYTWEQNILFFISLHFKCGSFLFVFFLVWLKNAELSLLRFRVWCSMLER